jgi:Ca2+-transporting ATPase
MQTAPRRPEAPILSLQRLRRLFGLRLVMALGTLGVLWHGLETGAPEHARTLAFTTFVAFQFFNAFNVRRENGSAFERYSLGNRSLWLALAVVIGLQLAATNWLPAQLAFDTVELSAADGVIVVAVASSILGIEETRKLLARRLLRRKHRAATETPEA